MSLRLGANMLSDAYVFHLGAEQSTAGIRQMDSRVGRDAPIEG